MKEILNNQGTLEQPDLAICCSFNYSPGGKKKTDQSFLGIIRRLNFAALYNFRRKPTTAKPDGD